MENGMIETDGWKIKLSGQYIQVLEALWEVQRLSQPRMGGTHAKIDVVDVALAYMGPVFDRSCLRFVDYTVVLESLRGMAHKLVGISAMSESTAPFTVYTWLTLAGRAFLAGRDSMRRKAPE